MKYKFPSKLAMVFFAVIFCFISGCMHYKNYHVFLAKKFEVKSSISKKKYWKPIVFSLDEKNLMNINLL